jgi:hypothetical protein
MHHVAPARPDDERFSYGVIFTRTNIESGETERIEWDGYGLLRELLEVMMDTATKQGWL